MNKDLLVKGMIFLAGGAIGSVVTWTLVKTKYEQTIEDKNEEILFLRDRYSESKIGKKAGESLAEGLKDGMGNPDKLTIQEIRDKVQELGRINDQTMNDKEEEDEKSVERPYVIAPEEFWEKDYPTIILTYYEEDDILADEHDKIIKNVDELVGKDFADHFGEYEEDSVHIRNHDMGVVYEILRDYGSYKEYMGIS